MNVGKPIDLYTLHTSTDHVGNVNGGCNRSTVALRRYLACTDIYQSIVTQHDCAIRYIFWNAINWVWLPITIIFEKKYNQHYGNIFLVMRLSNRNLQGIKNNIHLMIVITLLKK